eukprot:gnl/Dysnectes_brevis/10056_a19377_134.p1 GENE.gnl/Dysnectes_brevis/10056_a19377_134~~gnl/Dysnectes_brevis/10056_a19377_134.p1  ORF type:complete len:140 (+),score=40.77 gnl/Dysnectes_brevis/10056_a19377_134:120-539(+)
MDPQDPIAQARLQRQQWMAQRDVSQSTGGLTDSALADQELTHTISTLQTMIVDDTHAQQIATRRKRSRQAHGDEDLETDLNCPICLGMFRNPHTLHPCGHSFCKECIDASRRSARGPSCPICRQAVQGTTRAHLRAWWW